MAGSGRNNEAASDRDAGGNRAGVIGPERVRVREDEFHRFHVSVDGEEFANVRPLRVFPVSGKTDYISFLDDERKEAALVARPHKLDKESRRALRKALDKMYYVAKITRVDGLAESMKVSHWRVMTDRGYAAFEIVHSEHVRYLPGGRVLLTDADGNRFEIEDISRLDPRSQAFVRRAT